MWLTSACSAGRTSTPRVARISHCRGAWEPATFFVSPHAQNGNRTGCGTHLGHFTRAAMGRRGRAAVTSPNYFRNLYLQRDRRYFAAVRQATSRSPFGPRGRAVRGGVLARPSKASYEANISATAAAVAGRSVVAPSQPSRSRRSVVALASRRHVIRSLLTPIPCCASRAQGQRSWAHLFSGTAAV